MSEYTIEDILDKYCALRSVIGSIMRKKESGQYEAECFCAHYEKKGKVNDGVFSIFVDALAVELGIPIEYLNALVEFEIANAKRMK